MRTYPKSLYYTPEELDANFKRFCYEMLNVMLVGMFATTLLSFIVAVRRFGIVPGGSPLVMILGAIAIIVLLSLWATKGLGKESMLVLLVLSIMFAGEANYVQMWNNFQSRPTITHKQAERLYTKAGNLNIFARISDTNLINKYPTTILENKAQYDKIMKADEPKAFVFFKVGCPYCERAHDTIMKEAREAGVENKIHFVNYESDLGIELEYKYHINRSTTIIVQSAGHSWGAVSQSVYKNGERQLTPDTASIKYAMQLLK